MTVALVLGGAATLNADIAKYDGPADVIVACNDAGVEWSGPLDAWVSLHANYFRRIPVHGEDRSRPGWIERRAEKGYAPAERFYSNNARGMGRIILTPWQFPGQHKPEASLTSGLFAAKVALVDLACDRAVLCGIPMDVMPHFFDREDWQSATRYRKRLPNIPAEYRDRIRSMSGHTREFFGAP